MGNWVKVFRRLRWNYCDRSTTVFKGTLDLMNEEGHFPILPFLIGTVILAYLGLEITHHNELHAISTSWKEEEGAIAAVLEQMVERGELKPYIPAQPACNPGCNLKCSLSPSSRPLFCSEFRMVIDTQQTESPTASSRVGLMMQRARGPRPRRFCTHDTDLSAHSCISVLS